MQITLSMLVWFGLVWFSECDEHVSQRKDCLSWGKEPTARCVIMLSWKASIGDQLYAAAGSGNVKELQKIVEGGANVNATHSTVREFMCAPFLHNDMSFFLSVV
jgi:hypothetical protein